MRNFTVSKILRISKAFNSSYLDPYKLTPLCFRAESKRKIILEIGFGNGELITRMAKKRPKDLFFGIENSEISCEKAVKRAYDMELANVKFMRGDGKFLARELFTDNSVDLLLIFYPIPWPRESQAKKRLLTKDFLRTALTILKKSGKLVVVTDDKGYFEWITENMRTLEARFETHELVPIRSTKYGRKWKKLGRKSWSIVAYSKNFRITRIMEGGKLPHAHLKNLTREFVEEKLKALSCKKIEENGIVVEFKGMLNGENEYVLRTVSVDEDFPQMYYILVRHRDEEWLVRLDDIAKVFKTPAVKKSVEYVAEFLS